MPGTLRIGPGADDDDGRPTIALDARDDDVVSVPPPALVGQLIGGRYRVELLVGEGGMGAVFRGEHVRMRKRVAIKVLRPDAERLPEIVARFEREAIAGAHVDHPNVAAATDFGQLDDGSYYLILEYVEGERLSDVIARGPLPAARAARIARGVAEALSAVHKKGIVHRDVKPQNVMIGETPDGDAVKLIDFGLAKVRLELISEKARTGAGQALTGAGTIVGTISYLAPESALGMDAVDERADLYALGVVLFEMLSGQKPFDGPDDGAIFKQQRFSPAPRISERAPGVQVPPALEAIARRLLEKSPVDRYRTADELVRAIDAAAVAPADAPIETSAEEPASPREPAASPSRASIRSIPGLPRPRAAALRAWMTERPSWALAGIAAVVAALVVVVVALARRRAPEEAPRDLPPAAVAQDPTADTPAVPFTSAPPAALVDGLDAAAWRARLRHAVRAKDYDVGARAFLALAEIEPAALDEGPVRSDIVAVTAGVAFEANELSERVFDVMANKLGARGPDLLFEVVRSRGASRAAHRANELLRRPDVLGRATPQLKIALELSAVPCQDKPRLFARAAEEGDGRALVQLVVLKDAECGKKKDPCCFRDDAALADAIKRLKARLR